MGNLPIRFWNNVVKGYSEGEAPATNEAKESNHVLRKLEKRKKIARLTHILRSSLIHLGERAGILHEEDTGEEGQAGGGAGVA
ncbi:hypothetical protein WN944_010627 [Citrus x changshan-huyou]|uniref:Uncharacterized protein n=1 Tax=Citrus x changshan-huyou TaxID=2935761 RepID=A0AAP0MRY8_9ROSI